MPSTSSSAVPVLLPEIGESVTEGVVLEWRKAVGDVVEVGEPLLEVTTDKVDVEIPAPAGGVLTRIVAQEGETVEVGALLAELDASAEAAPAGAPAPEASGETRVVPIVLADMESITEGTVVEWRVGIGDAVAVDDVLLEVSTDKVDIEVPATVAGVLSAINVSAGDTFTIGDALGELTVGAGASAGAPAAKDAPAAPPAAAKPGAAKPPAGAQVEWPAISPVARRAALRAGIDPATITGSGPGGIIRKEDVAAAAARPAAPTSSVQPGASDDVQPLRGPAAALAGYMDESLSLPTATSFRTLTVTTLDAQRRKINADLAAAGRKEKLSFTHLIAWAIVRAASDALPVMGTGFAVVDGKPHKLVRDQVHLGLAVDVERKDGSRSLMVPVVKNASQMDFRAFRDAYDDLVNRTRFGGITPDELRGASITLTNPGGLGTISSVPRLMPGQGTIVATGSIGFPPGLTGADPTGLANLGVEKVMTMTSTYDHRVIQGAESGQFLGEIDRRLRGEEQFYEDLREAIGLSRDASLPAPAAPASAGAAPAAAAPAPAAAAPAAGMVDEALLEGVSAAMSVVKAHRSHGHLAANLDPLGAQPPGDPALLPETVNLTPEMMARIPASVLRVQVPGESFAAALPHLREAYCGTIAYEIEHLSDHQTRVWLRATIESGALRTPPSADERLNALRRLIEVDAFERFLRRTYLGQKTFSIEGVDALVTIADQVIEGAAADGADEVVMGMAHRGRLSFIAHVVGRPMESIIAEFEGHMAFESGDDEVRETAGDVKYHLGAKGTFTTRSGREVSVSLAANPSHLEQVNAVAEGNTRARQTDRSGREAQQDTSRVVPLVIHGDAAFPGQGIVAETLNMQALVGYTTGGTIHVIANNQIGFTTDPNDSRSTYHTSDLARGFDIPVIHVNADDPDACIYAARLAGAYRARYRRDVLINLIGYRRLGHNELDEPAYTQPVMSRTIKAHPPVSNLYAKRLVDEGVVSAAKVDELIAAAENRMRSAHDAVVKAGETGESSDPVTLNSDAPPPVTAVPEEELRELNEQLLHVPDSFTIHPKLKPQLARRREAMGEEGGIAWAHAEALAFASLLVQGVPIRLTGQDVARGTFSQRHLQLHDVGDGETWTPRTGRVYTPMANLPESKASFELHNSPLSEAATIGFEYGYSTEAPETLVIWEAQYGDFANGGQTMIDQFVVSGRAKWGERSRLVIMLPHGYEGNGPEHSSGRIERFLQLAAEDNIRVANCSTAANYFHLLRAHGLTSRLRPLVIFTPKSLLRAKSASSHLAELSSGEFRPVIADPTVDDPTVITRLIICSGKVAHDLANHRERASQENLAIGRLELLYPFPEEQIRELLASYPNLTEVTWVQEEPQNMGGWTFVAPLLQELLPEGITLGYEGRGRRASSSEGYPQAHATEQERLLQAAIQGGTNA